MHHNNRILNIKLICATDTSYLKRNISFPRFCNRSPSCLCCFAIPPSNYLISGPNQSHILPCLPSSKIYFECTYSSISQKAHKIYSIFCFPVEPQLDIALKSLQYRTVNDKLHIFRPALHTVLYSYSRVLYIQYHDTVDVHYSTVYTQYTVQ